MNLKENIRRIIREELGDEWNWAQEEPNIWRSYQMLLFDEVPTKEDVKKFIMDAFNSGLVCQEGIDAWMWGLGIGRDVMGIVNDAENNLKPYLRLSLDDEWFYTGIEYDDILDRYTDLRPIKYSEAKNYLMTESEDNELKWIKDIDPKDMTYRIGDTIKVHNLGNEESFLEWLGQFSEDYLDNKFGEFIIGKIVDITNNDRYEIIEHNTKEHIFFPSYTSIIDLRTNQGFGGHVYPDLDMYYEILQK